MTTALSPTNLRARILQAGPRGRAGLAIGAAALLGVVAFGASRLIAQVEGDRGILPVANSVDIQVNGIVVDVTGKTGAEARVEGWKQAEKKAWEKLNGPAMPIEAIDAMVSSVVIEREQIGPHRYVARLGVIFDRTKAGQYVGGGEGGGVHSAPMLVIPVLYSGGVRQVFEVRGAWQKAWAEFQASASPVDYVRPAGSGGESLILTAGQPGRRSRLWWRNILDQFNAADVVVPVARLERQWPGGPVRGTFTARYGPDSKVLQTFTMSVRNDEAVPQMLAKAVERIDGIYRDALIRGELMPDPTLLSGRIAFDNALAELRTRLMERDVDKAPRPAPTAPSAAPTITPEPVAQAGVQTVTVQFASPDAAAVDAALSAVRGAPGVQNAATTSLAIGGISVMRVAVSGGQGALVSALQARGWKVAASGSVLRISR
ncbi:type II secretory pathway component PulM [Novosphingobium chloroacetimidivorans]|uniref:Type II secretory pathway component PulM n=1 Tax=Novosphingobium chloroacetimidivorans TaxID=1428314 RepID=A0A7W7K6U0_9SPHN|nr:heavy-metal-associated domain-containing protein [Novosphingobium chloroacetimidivorans]MBB4856951.1 type II secretory pathway component PulM [Novosphingobium chloroacetimidivorans]